MNALVLVVIAALADGGPPDGLEWIDPAPVGREAVRRAAREQLGERWTASDFHLSMRRPLAFDVAPPSTESGSAELGRFVLHGDASAILRVGYVAGPILGDLGEMVTVVHNVVPRLAVDGARVTATHPQRVDVGGQPAVISELSVTPRGAEQPATVHFYAYVANGQHPGVLFTAVIPADRMGALRPTLLACVASLGTATVRPAAPGHEPPLVEEETPDAVPYPVFLVATVLLGAVLLRLFSRMSA